VPGQYRPGAFTGGGQNQNHKQERRRRCTVHYPEQFDATADHKGELTMAKEDSCGVNQGPILLNAGDKIKIIAKRIQGGGPSVTDPNQVRLRITKVS